MLNEYLRDQQGNLLFLLYNSGAGLKYHESVISEFDNKLCYKTVKCFKISAENIIDKNSLNHFIAELVKPSVFPVVPNKMTSDIDEYNEQALYNHVFRQIAHLEGKEITVSDLQKEEE